MVDAQRDIKKRRIEAISISDVSVDMLLVIFTQGLDLSELSSASKTCKDWRFYYNKITR